MRFAIVVLAAMAAFLGPNFVRASWQDDAAMMSETSSEPRLVAAMFRSSWCGACRILEPRIEDVREELGESADVDWVRFNFTWGQRDGVRDLAVEEGIEEVYDQFAGGTGFLVLMDRETGQVFEIVTMQYGRDEIREAVERWMLVVDRIEAGEEV
ncbi:thioredoxin family protein [Maricaulis parjimensis]|uniref:thioredoxin family protein n=1 Tax=Maricaulis parjimensis TaxID=144023 RepID=UPI001939A847|nr:thioredoxin family protein [Maricaulis parjimensis]